MGHPWFIVALHAQKERHEFFWELLGERWLSRRALPDFASCSMGLLAVSWPAGHFVLGFRVSCDSPRLRGLTEFAFDVWVSAAWGW